MNWSDISAIASAAIALVALALSAQSFKAQRQSFQAQQRWAEENAQANVRPLLWIRLLGYTNLKAVILRNDGLGPAVITKTTFTKNGESTDRLVDLFHFPIKFHWETFTSVEPGQVIPPQGEIILVKQSQQHLDDQKIDAAQKDDVMKNWKSQRSGIEVQVEFRDIYGRTMPTYREVI